ncbi:toprim domain-containing protein [Spirillospora sp. NPDC052242]
MTSASDASAGRTEREDERNRQLDVLHGIAVHRVTSLYEGRLTWEQWLEDARHHARFGFINTLLIPAQRSSAIDVRSYDDWQRLGRQVLRGEAGIRIISTRGRPRPVFDIAQTSGEAPDESARPMPVQGLARLSQLAAELGLYVDRGQGWTYLGRPEQRITISPELDDTVAATMLAHQLAHAIQPADHVDPPTSDAAACRSVRRVVADSVAYLVLAELGLTGTIPAFPPTRQWAGTDERAAPAAAIRAVGEQVLRTTARLRRRMTNLHAGPSKSPTAAPEANASVGPSSGVNEREEVLAAVADAHRFFVSNLRGSWSADYLADRGFTPAVQERWEVGHASRARQALVQHLRERGHADQLIVHAGLARQGRSGDLTDLFYNRVLLPFRDEDGAVVGFIGRRPDGGNGPKYLNTPETAVFHKHELLFGLTEGRERLAQGVRPLLVEGPLDAIAVNVTMPAEYVAVAPCGTAITPAHVDALGRRCDLKNSGLVLALDGDRAGRTAVLRSWRTLRHITGPIDAAMLPEGRDPADLLSPERQSAVIEGLHASIPLPDLLVDERLDEFGELKFIETRLAAARSAARVIAELPPSQIARQVTRVAARTEVDPAEVTAAVASAISPEPTKDASPARPAQPSTHTGSRSTRHARK